MTVLVLTDPSSPLIDSFLLCLGVVKSILHIGAYSTLRNDGGSRSEVEECCSLTFVFSYAANKTAATCEHTSPSPAMYVQWAHKIVPSDLIDAQTFSGVADKLWECLTLAVKMKWLAFPSDFMTDMLLIHTLAK